VLLRSDTRQAEDVSVDKAARQFVFHFATPLPDLDSPREVIRYQNRIICRRSPSTLHSALLQSGPDECHIMRKTVQEWMDANNQSLGLSKKKLAAAKRSKKFPAHTESPSAVLPALKRLAKKRLTGGKGRRPK
jgi:hypothetical protein